MSKEAAISWLGAKFEEYSDKVGAEDILITPEIASLILEKHNLSNRHISTNIVDQLCADMRHGRFKADNGETIIFSKEGLLNDGQHRLSAVVKSGIGQVFTIAFGRDRASRLTVDTGIKRTIGHVLGLLGKPYGNTLAAAAKRVESFRNTGNITSSGRVSSARTLEIIDGDVLLDEVAAWAHNHSFKALRLPPSEIATSFYLFSEKAPRQAKQFFEALREGYGLEKGSPIATLRTKLLNSPRLNLTERFELLVRCWNFWIRDEKIDRYSIMGRIPEILGPKRNANNAEGK